MRILIFIEAKEILVDLLNQQEYAEKKQYDVLRSAEFCRKTQDTVKRNNRKSIIVKKYYIADWFTKNPSAFFMLIFYT